jgi:hypothetical protein
MLGPPSSHTSSSTKIRRCCVDRLNPPGESKNELGRYVISVLAGDLVKRCNGKKITRGQSRCRTFVGGTVKRLPARAVKRNAVKTLYARARQTVVARFRLRPTCKLNLALGARQRLYRKAVEPLYSWIILILHALFREIRLHLSAPNHRACARFRRGIRYRRAAAELADCGSVQRGTLAERL